MFFTAGTLLEMMLDDGLCIPGRNAGHTFTDKPHLSIALISEVL